MSRLSEKHTPYFELLESLQEAKLCVLCEMRERSTHRYLDSLLYESVNDTDLRAILIKSRGFCPDHTERLLQFGDALGTSILYQDQVEEVLRFLSGLKRQQGRAVRGKAGNDWQRHAPCPVCEQEAKVDALRIKTLLHYLSDSELRKALEESPGLCIPHLLQTLGKSRKADLRTCLVELHEKKFDRLREELKEFIRKQDYQNRGEKYGTEANAWKRSPWMILGKR